MHNRSTYQPAPEPAMPHHFGDYYEDENEADYEDDDGEDGESEDARFSPRDSCLGSISTEWCSGW